MKKIIIFGILFLMFLSFSYSQDRVNIPLAEVNDIGFELSNVTG